MLRIAGAALISFAGFWAGQTAKERLKRHAAALAGLASACSVMKSEISFLHTPPEEIISALSVSSGPEAAFFKNMSRKLKIGARSVTAAWKSAIVEESEAMGLSAAERSELTRLGESLGKYDLEGTLAFVSAAEMKFIAWALAAAKRAEADGKLYATLWTTSGLAAAILLL